MSRRGTLAYLAARVGWAGLTLVAIMLAGRQTAHAAAAPSGRLAYTGSDGIYVLKLDGSASQRIWKAPAGGQGVAPRWSEDGTRIAFEGPDGNIWVMNSDGTAAHALESQATPGSGCADEGCAVPGTVADSARWSHDGTYISYRLVEGLARGSIWTVPVDGSTAPQLITSATDLCIFNEGWSPDGRQLFSRCATDGSPSNATYAAAPTQRPVVAGSQLAYSSDGSRLAFSNHALSSGAIAVNLFLAAGDGSGAQAIARGGQNPDWSHGGMLAYQVDGDNGWLIHVYDPASGTDTAVGSGMLGGWTPDGAYIYYTTISDTGSAIWRVHADGTDNAFVTAGSFPDWTG